MTISVSQSGVLSQDLRSVLEYAIKHVSFYNHVPEPSIEAFPVVSKQDYRSGFELFLSTAIDPVDRSSILEVSSGLSNSSPTPTLREVRQRGAVLERSSGTTGPCVWYPKSRSEHMLLALRAVQLRRRYNPSLRSVEFIDITALFLDPTYRATLEKPSRDGIVSFYDKLVRPSTHLYGYAPLLVDHARLLSQSRAIIRPAMVEISGEHLCRNDYQLIRETFQCPVINQYGTRETWSLAYAADGCDFFIPSGADLIEVLADGTDQPCSEGVLGEIVVTSSVCRWFPIIRFRTGDRGCWRQVGSATGLFLEPEREEQIFTLANGHRCSGYRYFKRLLETLVGPSGSQVLGPWKVRQLGVMLELYLMESDLASVPALLVEVASRRHELGHIELQIVVWKGWGFGEKRLAYINRTLSS